MLHAKDTTREAVRTHSKIYNRVRNALIGHYFHVHVLNQCRLNPVTGGMYNSLSSHIRVTNNTSSHFVIRSSADNCTFGPAVLDLPGGGGQQWIPLPWLLPRVFWKQDLIDSNFPENTHLPAKCPPHILIGIVDGVVDKWRGSLRKTRKNEGPPGVVAEAEKKEDAPENHGGHKRLKSV